MPSTTKPKQYAKALYELLEEHKGEEDDIIKKFIEYLVGQNDLRKKEEIFSSFEDVYLEREGKERVTVESASEVSEDLKKAIEEFGPTTYKIDKSLIGGMRIRVGDMLVDGTVKKYISQLKRN